MNRTRQQGIVERLLSDERQVQKSVGELPRALRIAQLHTRVRATSSRETTGNAMVAKVWANSLVVLLATALSLWLVVQGLLAVPIAGSIPLFLLGTLLHLFATTAMGIFMGTIARSMPQLGLLAILIILPLHLLSGGITPRESMPEIVQDIILLAPTTHFASLAQAILYRGAGFEVVWPSFMAIFGIGFLFFLATLWRFRRTVEATQI